MVLPQSQRIIAVTTELYWLTLTVLMTALFWVPYVLNRVVVSGLGGALAGTSPKSEGHSDWANRAIKAHTNAIENLAVFAPIVLTAHLLNISNGATKAAVACTTRSHKMCSKAPSSTDTVNPTSRLVKSFCQRRCKKG